MYVGFLQRTTKKALEDIGRALEKNPTHDLAQAFTRLAAFYAKREAPSRNETQKQRVAIATMQARMSDLEKKIQIKLDNMDGFRRAIGAKLG